MYVHEKAALDVFRRKSTKARGGIVSGRGQESMDLTRLNLLHFVEHYTGGLVNPEKAYHTSNESEDCQQLPVRRWQAKNVMIRHAL
jgi:hypothetical protein